VVRDIKERRIEDAAERVELLRAHLEPACEEAWHCRKLFTAIAEAGGVCTTKEAVLGQMQQQGEAYFRVSAVRRPGDQVALAGCPCPVRGD
jgi:hypothetical protein